MPDTDPASSAIKSLIAKDSFTAQTRRGWIPAQGREDEIREFTVQTVLRPLNNTSGPPLGTSDHMAAAAPNERVHRHPPPRHTGPRSGIQPPRVCAVRDSFDTSTIASSGSPTLACWIPAQGR